MSEQERQRLEAELREMELQLAAARAEARAFRTAFHSLRLSVEKHIEEVPRVDAR
ncbi:hypothetical protein M2317_000820 [Microbacterium sp. ZKA21]|uniref:hypothetical protein n=1 Tax=Microbacterium sp. ZKA21 TaxID=3381694 RepID=UPI003D1B5461